MEVTVHIENLSYRIFLYPSSPVRKQLRDYFLTHTNRSPSRFMYSCDDITPRDTILSLGLRDGANIDGVSDAQANPRLVDHLRSEGFDASQFTFIDPDIAVIDL